MAYGYRDTASAWDSDGSVATSAITTVAGDTLIGLTLGVGDLRSGSPLGAGTSLTLTDSKGNMMARLGPAIYFSADDFTAQLWISQGIQNAGSSHTWTVGGAGVTACAVAVSAYSGLAPRFSLAALSINTQTSLGTGSNAAVSGSDANTGHANCLVFGFGYASEGAPNAGTGFTSRAAVWPLGGGPNVLRIQDQRVTSVASQQATFTNTATGNNMSIMVVLKEDDAQVNEVLQLTDNFSGSSGVELSVYNTNWHAPNGGNKLKGSGQAGPSIIGGGDVLEDTPLHRVDFLPDGDHWAKISADEFTTGYCAALTRCFDGQGYDQLSHYGHGVEAAGRNLYVQVLGALTTFLSAPAPAEGVDIGCHSVGKFHYASVDDVVDLIHKDTQLTGGYWGAGSVADGSDVVRWSNFRCGIIGPAATVVSAVTPDAFDDADTGIVVDGSGYEASQGSGGIVISPVAHPSGDIPPYPSMGTPGLDLAVTSGSSNALNMPANITAGDLLLAFIAHDRNGSSTAIALSGWTDITNASNGTVVGLAIFAKIAVGGDTGTVTASNNDLVAKVYRVPAAVHGVSNVATDILKGTAATGSGSAPNPPSVSGLNSALKYLVIEVAASDDDDNTTNYQSTNYQKCVQIESAQSTSSCMISIATRQLTGATSEDPGNMALAATEEWVTQTLAIPQRASAGLAVPQTETAWGATQVTFTADQDYFAYDVPVYLFAVNNAGGWNWGGFAVQFEAGGGDVQLVVGDCAHGQASDGAALTQASSLSVQESVHAHVVASVELSLAYTLSPGESVHLQASGGPDLTQANVLAPGESAHAQVSDEPELAQAGALDVAESAHEQAADEPELSQAGTVSVGESAHTQAADEVVLSQSVGVEPGESVHGHHTDDPELTQAGILTVGDSAHDNAVDGISLIQAAVLAVVDSIHVHASNGPVLSQAQLLEVGESVHAIITDAADLTQAHVLAVQEAVHAHIADSADLSSSGFLAVGSSVHGHASGAPELVQAAILTVGESVHTLATAQIALSQGVVLSIGEAVHALATDGVTLSHAMVLAVASAVHLQAAEAIDLSQATTIVVSDSIHAHVAQQLNLLMPGGPIVPPDRTIVVQARSRVIVIQPESRTIRVH